MLSNKRMILKKRPPFKQDRFEDCLECVTEQIDTNNLKDGEFVVKNLYCTVDVANRFWMVGDGFVSEVKLDGVMKGGAIGQVVASKNPDFPLGAKTEGNTNWQQYSLCAKSAKGTNLTDSGSTLKRLPPDADAQVEIGPCWNMTGYALLFYDGKPRPNDTILISAAAGGTGVYTGTLAKAVIPGCKVIGTAGTDAKCKWLVEEMGFDAAINYNTEGQNDRDFGAAIKKHAPKGVNVVYDNVGGTFLNAALRNLAIGARVVICGAISQLRTSGGRFGKIDYGPIMQKHANFTGSPVYLHRGEKISNGRAHVRHLMKEGKLKIANAVYEGVESCPEALASLYDSANKNMGKVCVHIGDEDKAIRDAACASRPNDSVLVAPYAAPAPGNFLDSLWLPPDLTGEQTAAAIAPMTTHESSASKL